MDDRFTAFGTMAVKLLLPLTTLVQTGNQTGAAMLFVLVNR